MILNVADGRKQLQVIAMILLLMEASFLSFKCLHTLARRPATARNRCTAMQRLSAPSSHVHALAALALRSLNA